MYLKQWYSLNQTDSPSLFSPLYLLQPSFLPYSSSQSFVQFFFLVVCFLWFFSVSLIIGCDSGSGSDCCMNFGRVSKFLMVMMDKMFLVVLALIGKMYCFWIFSCFGLVTPSGGRISFFSSEIPSRKIVGRRGGLPFSTTDLVLVPTLECSPCRCWAFPSRSPSG